MEGSDDHLDRCLKRRIPSGHLRGRRKKARSNRTKPGLFGIQLLISTARSSDPTRSFAVRIASEDRIAGDPIHCADVWRHPCCIIHLLVSPGSAPRALSHGQSCCCCPSFAMLGGAPRPLRTRDQFSHHLRKKCYGSASRFARALRCGSCKGTGSVRWRARRLSGAAGSRGRVRRILPRP